MILSNGFSRVVLILGRNERDLRSMGLHSRYCTAFARWQLCVILVLLLSARSTAAIDIVGRVTSVVDGDTLKILSERTEITVRLDQIDAPERGQPFGDRAKRSLAELAFGKDARAVPRGQDRYGRTVATVYIDGTDVNAEQVRRGMAWVYRKYARDQSLVEIETEARASRRGLWIEPDPVPPWQGRARARAIDGTRPALQAPLSPK